MCDHPRGLHPEVCAECRGDGVIYQLDGQFDCLCPTCRGEGWWWWCSDCDNTYPPGSADLDEWLDQQEVKENNDPSLPWVGLDIG